MPNEKACSLNKTLDLNGLHTVNELLQNSVNTKIIIKNIKLRKLNFINGNKF